MIEITDAAKDKIQDVLNENKGKYLRIVVEGGGWGGGPRLGMALDEPRGNEEAIQVNGIDVLISSEVKPAADVHKIDYVKSPRGEGFIIAPTYGQSCC